MSRFDAGFDAILLVGKSRKLEKHSSGVEAHVDRNEHVPGMNSRRTRRLRASDAGEPGDGADAGHEQDHKTHQHGQGKAVPEDVTQNGAFLAVAFRRC